MRYAAMLVRCIAMILFVIAGASANAEMLPQFDMDRCVGDAKLIVRGRLDQGGNIDITEVMRGERPPKMALARKDIYESFRLSMGAESGPIEVLVFASSQRNGAWTTPLDYAGTVGLDGQKVFLFQDGFRNEQNAHLPRAIRDPHHDREPFLALVRQAIRDSDHRDAILSMPRGEDRAKKLLAFLLDHCACSPNSENLSRGQYHMWKITGALRPADPLEQRVIIQCIKQTQDALARSMILGLAGSIPLSPTALDDFAPFVDVSYPRPVRRAAISAISRIDDRRALSHLLPLLTFKETELDAALAAVGMQPEDRTDLWRDPRVMEAMLALLVEMRQSNVQYLQAWAPGIPLGHLLREYAHPRIVTSLSDWLMDSGHPGAPYAAQSINHILSTNWPQDRLITWWKQHRARLDTAYDLATADGRRLWFAAYAEGGNDDTQYRHLLMQLWLFEARPDESALIQAAQSEQTATAAKAVLGTLWKAGRLSNACRKAIFEAFVKLDLVEGPATPGSPDRRELRIRGVMDFPFDTEVWYRGTIAIDGEPILPPDRDNQVVLEPTTKTYDFAGISTSCPGRPTATAVLQVRQVDYYHGRTELWRSEKRFGPLQMRDSRLLQTSTTESTAGREAK